MTSPISAAGAAAAARPAAPQDDPAPGPARAATPDAGTPVTPLARPRSAGDGARPRRPAPPRRHATAPDVLTTIADARSPVAGEDAPADTPPATPTPASAGPSRAAGDRTPADLPLPPPAPPSPTGVASPSDAPRSHSLDITPAKDHLPPPAPPSPTGVASPSDAPRSHSLDITPAEDHATARAPEPAAASPSRTRRAASAARTPPALRPAPPGDGIRRPPRAEPLPGSAAARIAQAGRLMQLRGADPAGDAFARLPSAASKLLAQSRDWLQSQLDGMTIDPAQDPQVQQELKRLFIRDNAPIDAAWSALFGAKYRHGGDVASSFAEGSMSASYEFARGFVSSAFRSPARNGAVAAWSPAAGARLSVGSEHAVDADAQGGVLGGVGSYVNEKAVQPAIARQASRHNLPRMVPVPAHLLVPEPGPVRLHAWQENGRPMVRFYVAGHAWGTGHDAAAVAPEHADGIDKPATMAALDSLARRRRDSAATWQAAYDAKHVAALLQPFLTAALNSLRPEVLHTAAQRSSAISVFAVSALLSSSAGGLAKGSLDLMKSLPRLGDMAVDGPVGPQRLGLYIAEGRGDAGAGMPRWRDLGSRHALQLPVAAGLALLESLGRTALLAPQTLSSFSSLTDLFMRHLGPNVLASSIAPAATNATLEVFTNTDTPPPNEDPLSLVGRIRSALPSGLNEYLWASLPRMMDGLTARTDERRQERRQVQAARRAVLENNRQRLGDQLRQHRAELPALIAACPLASPADRTLARAVRDQAADARQALDATQLDALDARLAQAGPAHPDAADALRRRLQLMSTSLRQLERIDDRLDRGRMMNRFERALMPWDPPARLGPAREPASRA